MAFAKRIQRSSGLTILVGLLVVCGMASFLLYHAWHELLSSSHSSSGSAAAAHAQSGRFLPSRSKPLRSRVPRAFGGGVPVRYRAVRLADRLADANYSGPDPTPAWHRLSRHWRKMLDPYANLGPRRAPFRIKAAFLVPDVVHYLDPTHVRTRRPYLGEGERRWTYTHGVYESRLALFSPLSAQGRARAALHRGDQGRMDRGTPTGRAGLSSSSGGHLSFVVRLPKAPVLRFGVGVIPETMHETAPVRFVVEVDGGDGSKRVYNRTLGPLEFLAWHEDRVSLAPWAGRTVTLHFRTNGRGAGSLWMDPCIWGEHTPSRSGPIGGGRGSEDPKYNLVFILVDTMRPDAITALGGRYAKTPNMDGLARGGTAMTRFFTNGSWTRASMVAFFSANYDSAVGLRSDTFGFRQGVRQRFYEMRPPQFPWHMERLGYSVAGVVNNFFALPYAAIGVDHGFSRLTDVRHPRLDSPAITRAAIRFLRRNRNRRFFLYVHYLGLHDYVRRPTYLSSLFSLPDGVKMDEYWRAYLELGRQQDEEVGRLRRVMAELGLTRNTLVVLTADHGETFSKAHKQYVPFYHQSMLYQHARSVWDEVTHIPMIWYLPGRVPQGKKVTTQLRAIDLFPSVLDALGLPPMVPVAGRSFWPLVAQAGRSKQDTTGSAAASTGRGEPGDRPVYTEGFHIYGLRWHEYKYIERDAATRRFSIGHHPVDRPEELFDLKQDPGETIDLSHRRPDLLARMRQLMQDIRKRSRYERLRTRFSNSTSGRIAPAWTSSSWLSSFLPESRSSAAARTSAAARVPTTHLLLCSAHGRRHLSGRFLTKDPGASLLVRQVVGAAQVERQGLSGLRIDLVAQKGCSGLAWATTRTSETKLVLTLDGRPVRASQLHVGRFGLPVLTRLVLSPSDALLRSVGRPAVLDVQPQGIFVWQDRVVTRWIDRDSASRDKVSRSMVRTNLLRGGYVKSGHGRQRFR